MSDAGSQARDSGTDQSHGPMLLFRIDFRHDYYNLDSQRCEDFTVVPTADTAALMASVGLRVHQRSAGLDIYLPANRKDAFLRTIDGDRAASLGFLLVVKNPAFIGVTALPIDTNPNVQAIYASNMEVSRQGQEYHFGASGTIQPSSLVAVSRSEIPVNNDATGTVVARNVRGDIVVSVDTGNQDASLSLAGQPFGLYSISASPSDAYSGPEQLLYLPAARSPVALLELALKQPADGDHDRGAFPTSDDDQTIAAVDLVMQFAARHTFWSYYVVGQPAGRIFAADLNITGTGASFTKSPAHLPNGDEAILFAATEATPMRQKATSQYGLSGSFVDPSGRTQAVNVARLPTAPTTPVWPAVGDNMAGRSEIYVYV